MTAAKEKEERQKCQKLNREWMLNRELEVMRSASHRKEGIYKVGITPKQHRLLYVCASTGFDEDRIQNVIKGWLLANRPI